MNKHSQFHREHYYLRFDAERKPEEVTFRIDEVVVIRKNDAKAKIIDKIKWGYILDGYPGLHFPASTLTKVEEAPND